MADAQHRPQGRHQAGDRHLKFHETRDNLVACLVLLRAPGSGLTGGFWAGCRRGYPVVTAPVSLVWITAARAVMSRFAEARAIWRWLRFLASPR